MAAASPDRYRPDLARFLTNLAEALMARERTAAANAVREEAATLGGKITVTMDIYTEVPSAVTRKALKRLGKWLDT